VQAPRCADIAVIIPTLNEAARIAPCLAAVAALGFTEIIVVDGGSTDGTVEIVRSIDGVRCISAKRGRGSQLQVGVRAAMAPMVVMLHADTRLPATAVASITAALDDARVVAGCFRLRFDNPNRSLRVFAWFSRFETLFTSFGDQAIFARRVALLAVGVPDWPLLEDVAIRSRLRATGRFVKLKPTVVTSARRFEQFGIWRAQLRNFWVLAGYLMGIPPHHLATFYRAERH
jgi:rSAM/selenodomain-associated transferase 2